MVLVIFVVTVMVMMTMTSLRDSILKFPHTKQPCPYLMIRVNIYYNSLIPVNYFKNAAILFSAASRFDML